MIQVKDEAEFDHLISIPNRVLVQFSAEWCGPCKVLTPTMERIKEEYEWLGVIKVDVDANPGIVKRFGVRGIPTVIAFDNGVEAKRFSGVLTQAKIEEFIGVAFE